MSLRCCFHKATSAVSHMPAPAVGAMERAQPWPQLRPCVHVFMCASVHKAHHCEGLGAGPGSGWCGSLQRKRLLWWPCSLLATSQWHLASMVASVSSMNTSSCDLSTLLPLQAVSVLPTLLLFLSPLNPTFHHSVPATHLLPQGAGVALSRSSTTSIKAAGHK